MTDLIIEFIYTALDEYDTFECEELSVGAPVSRADRAELGITIGGKPFTIIVREGER